jgi:tripartite-type tricarboxylate transporter receptor subunit TctC
VLPYAKETEGRKFEQRQRHSNPWKHIKTGSVKPLAVMTDKRVADLPDVPTIAEAGFPEATILPSSLPR